MFLTGFGFIVLVPAILVIVQYNGLVSLRNHIRDAWSNVDTQLKAELHFLRLQEELVNTEDRIQAARRFYNGNVRDCRNNCESVPSNILASIFGFEAEPYFGVEAEERVLPIARM